jgi:hypothetical protein
MDGSIAAEENSISTSTPDLACPELKKIIKRFSPELDIPLAEECRKLKKELESGSEEKKE